jgi:hypothetical protein
MGEAELMARDWLMWTIEGTKHARFPDGVEIEFSEAEYESLATTEEREAFVLACRAEQEA